VVPAGRRDWLPAQSLGVPGIRAPWNHIIGIGPSPLPPSPPSPPAPPPPPGPPGPPTFAGTNKQFLARQPTEDRRMGRFTETVASILNSLQRRGQLFFTGVEDQQGQSWSLGGQPLQFPYAPGPHNDNTQGIVPGNIWIDTTSGVAYLNLTNAAGSATWQQIGTGGSSPGGVTGVFT